MTSKILVVDDERDISELVAFNLREEGYEVLTAIDGMQALNLARQSLPDLIVLDLMLPELDGVAVCEILKRLPSTAAIPVVMLTGWATEQARHIGLQAGATEYVTKPFSPRDLVRRINAILRVGTDRTAPDDGTSAAA
jgi:two-component system alkaline phosphatase synthesis response regulator PhoP